MPSVSKNQQIAAAIALKAKEEGKSPKKGTASAQMAKMSQDELKKFARLGVDFATVLYSNQVYKEQEEKENSSLKILRR